MVCPKGSRPDCRAGHPLKHSTVLYRLKWNYSWRSPPNCQRPILPTPSSRPAMDHRRNNAFYTYRPRRQHPLKKLCSPFPEPQSVSTTIAPRCPKPLSLGARRPPYRLVQKGVKCDERVPGTPPLAAVGTLCPGLPVSMRPLRDRRREDSRLPAIQ
jgi:hypothetical protein